MEWVQIGKPLIPRSYLQFCYNPELNTVLLIVGYSGIELTDTGNGTATIGI